ncbi:MAG: cysteine--tRNA ligase [Anaerolineales bacterium]|nr:cysteine--tRNA ligase [Chloroflexota bacterium]MBL6982530.1 cysteine--tRNA ligase [Anaerolineales bacterium]
MTIKIYNTLSRKKEDFETLEPKKASMYVCGPTVYDKAHVGHAMSVLVFDIIRRYLEYRGYEVLHAMNYTDVDDKIIQRAIIEEIDPFDLAERYIQEFREHLDDLNILPATVYPRATQEIDHIIEMVQGLIEKGHAYESEGDVYFFVSSDDDYGKLSGRKLEDMQSGFRIDVDDRKETPMDFALWKSSKPGEPSWESPWGQGRPGWHIECSAMSYYHLGEQIDIHGGGNDLVFPHHENEIAQTESLTGKPFARYWVHNGMMQLRGAAMSKSTGNLVTIEEFLAQHDADILRMMVLNSSYRSPLKFSDETVGHAKKALDRLRSALRPATPGAAGEMPETLEAQITATRQGVEESMADDINTAGALGYLFELVRAINYARDDGTAPDALAEAQRLILEYTGIMGLKLDHTGVDGRSGTGEAAPFVDLLIELRAELRNQKLWELTDKVRDSLAELGVVLEDGKEGTTWRWG